MKGVTTSVAIRTFRLIKKDIEKHLERVPGHLNLGEIKKKGVTGTGILITFLCCLYCLCIY